MKKITFEELVQLSFILFIFALLIASCSIKERFEQRDEIIAGVPIPIPRGMGKVSDGRVEVTLPGFGGEKAAYRGDVDSDDVLAFYKREMPERGWRSNASIVVRGGMLAYTRENRSILIVVSSPDRGDTTLNIVVGSLGSK